MIKLVYAIALGLVGAGLLHIGMLLAMPGLAEHSAWTRLAAAVPPYRVVRADGAAGGPLLVSSSDPLFLTAACRFDLTAGTARVAAHGTVPFWSASVFDRDERIVSSFSDSAAEDRSLDLAILTPERMAEVRRQPPEALGAAVVVASPTAEGIVVMRVFAPDDSWNGAAAAWLGSLSCAAE